jgi:hypothetical protein
MNHSLNHHPSAAARGTPARRDARWAGLAAGALLAIVGTPALSDTLTWRQTSVVASQSGAVTLRKGVAILDTRETATMQVQLRALAPPVNGSFDYTSLMEYQFSEGSTLALRFDGRSRVLPDGRPEPGEFRVQGTIAGGSGRFAGATGSFQMRIKTGLDTRFDGILGDNFAVVELDYTPQR